MKNKTIQYSFAFNYHEFGCLLYWLRFLHYFKVQIHAGDFVGHTTICDHKYEKLDK